MGAGRLGELKALLASPGWLERKLHSYGTASVVADFRRHLMVGCQCGGLSDSLLGIAACLTLH